MTEHFGVRVARGASLLDDRIPGWADMFETAELNDLDVMNGDHCILAVVALHQNDHDGLRYMKLYDSFELEETSSFYGFCGWEPELNTLWREEIRQRQEVPHGSFY